MSPQTENLGILGLLTTLELAHVGRNEFRKLVRLDFDLCDFLLSIGGEDLACLLESLVRKLLEGEVVHGSDGESSSPRADGEDTRLHERGLEVGTDGVGVEIEC